MFALHLDQSLNYFCQKEVVKIGCSVFNFRAPLSLSTKFTGKYEVIAKDGNNIPIYKKIEGDAFVYVNSHGNWVFSEDETADFGKIWLRKTVPCPANEQGNVCNIIFFSLKF